MNITMFLLRPTGLILLFGLGLIVSVLVWRRRFGSGEKRFQPWAEIAGYVVGAILLGAAALLWIEEGIGVSTVLTMLLGVWMCCYAFVIVRPRVAR